MLSARASAESARVWAPATDANASVVSRIELRRYRIIWLAIKADSSLRSGSLPLKRNRRPANAGPRILLDYGEMVPPLTVTARSCPDRSDHAAHPSPSP